MLSQWMAHHVADCIVRARDAPASERTATREECRRAIFELWAHRAELPNGMRPFEALEPVVATLKALDPEARHVFYHRRFAPPTQIDADNPTERRLDLARAADKGSRLVIGGLLEQAAEQALDQAAPWIDLARRAGAPDGPDLTIIIALSGEDEAAEQRSLLMQPIQDQLDAVQTLINQANILAEGYRQELKAIESSEIATEE